MKSIIGYIPAGGKGKRMKPFKLSKELIPVDIPKEDGSHVVLLIENAIQTLAYGGIKDIIFTVNNEKDALVKCTNNYYVGKMKINSAYVYQDNKKKEYGLPYAIAGAAPFLKGRTVFMKFPDTIVYPYDCFKELYKFHMRKASDLTLGIFPTDHPERLGPVIVDIEGKVKRIEDKPKKPSIKNTWNIIIWEDNFLNLVIDTVENARRIGNIDEELILSDIFQRSIQKNLRVYGYTFENGFCYDISCIEDVKYLWNGKENNMP